MSLKLKHFSAQTTGCAAGDNNDAYSQRRGFKLSWPSDMGPGPSQRQVRVTNDGGEVVIATDKGIACVLAPSEVGTQGV